MRSMLLGYIKENRSLIEIIGFVGVAASLFLNISSIQNDNLRNLQVFLLLIFGLGCLTLFFDLLAYMFQKFKSEFKANEVVNIALIFQCLTLLIAIFIFSLYFFKFIFSEFSYELVRYFKIYSILPMLAIDLFLYKMVDYLPGVGVIFQRFLKEYIITTIPLIWLSYIIMGRIWWPLFFVYILTALEESKIISRRVLLLCALLAIFFLSFMLLLNILYK